MYLMISQFEMVMQENKSHHLNSDVCWLRLDFDLFTLAGPETVTCASAGSCNNDPTSPPTDEEGTCTDTMKVTVGLRIL